MTNRDVTCIVEAARKADAQALTVPYEGEQGAAGTFSVPLSTAQGVTNPALATHFGMTGQMLAEEADFLEASVDPMVNVTNNESGGGFAAIIASRAQPLYTVNEPI